MPSTDSKAIHPRAAPFQQPALTDQATSLPMRSVMTGAKDTYPTRHSIPIRSCYTELLEMNASQDPLLRRGSFFAIYEGWNGNDQGR